MSKHSTTQQCAAAKKSTWMTAILSGAAAVAVVFGVYLALDPEDTEPLESPLLLSIARQMESGPWELYGPFGGLNPYVLIHAPLYYHAAAMVAWPLYRAGLSPVAAALAAGRSLSFLGLAWTLAIAYWLARLDGMPRRVGWWAVLLIAASPVVGVMPYTVRPDMVGVALQTTGVFLVLSVLHSERPAGASLAAAFASFGLAVCVKQHYVAAPAVSTFLLLLAWLRGRLSFKFVARGLLAGLAIVLIVYGTEELATGGMMSQAVFRAAATVSAVHPGDWVRSSIVLFTTVGKSSGLIAIMIAADLAIVGARRGTGRFALVVVGTGVTILIDAWCLLNLLGIRVTDSHDLLLSVLNLATGAFLVIPACHLLTPRDRSGGALDRALWTYLAAELGMLTILARMSTGAWVNYGIQAVICFSVLAARALARAFENILTPQAFLRIALAAVVVLIAVTGDTVRTAVQHRVERLALAQILEHLRRPSTECFVVAHPGDNRVNGRLDLVYDDWLYPVFESIHLAEPRSAWLRRALTSGATRFVISTSESPNIDGLGEMLPQLGYVKDFKLERFYVWKRSASVRTPVRNQ